MPRAPNLYSNPGLTLGTDPTDHPILRSVYNFYCRSHTRYGIMLVIAAFSLVFRINRQALGTHDRLKFDRATFSRYKDYYCLVSAIMVAITAFFGGLGLLLRRWCKVGRPVNYTLLSSRDQVASYVRLN